MDINLKKGDIQAFAAHFTTLSANIKMTGETPEVRSDKRRREEREEEEKKRRKRRKIIENHGASWNIMDHLGIENWEFNAD